MSPYIDQAQQIANLIKQTGYTGATTTGTTLGSKLLSNINPVTGAVTSDIQFIQQAIDYSSGNPTTVKSLALIGSGAVAGAATAGAIGAIAGGAAAGSVVPGIGTLIGAGIGAGIVGINYATNKDTNYMNFARENIYRAFASGGTTPATANVEHGEVARMPNGAAVRFKGKRHEKGGINTQLPTGSQIFSNRITVDGKIKFNAKNTIANEANKILTYMKRVTDNANKNAAYMTNSFAKNTFMRKIAASEAKLNALAQYQEDAKKALALMQQLQLMKNNKTKMPKLPKFAAGGWLGQLGFNSEQEAINALANAFILGQNKRNKKTSKKSNINIPVAQNLFNMGLFGVLKNMYAAGGNDGTDNNKYLSNTYRSTAKPYTDANLFLTNTLKNIPSYNMFLNTSNNQQQSTDMQQKFNYLNWQMPTLSLNNTILKQPHLDPVMFNGNSIDFNTSYYDKLWQRTQPQQQESGSQEEESNKTKNNKKGKTAEGQLTKWDKIGIAGIAAQQILNDIKTVWQRLTDKPYYNYYANATVDEQKQLTSMMNNNPYAYYQSKLTNEYNRSRRSIAANARTINTMRALSDLASARYADQKRALSSSEANYLAQIAQRLGKVQTQGNMMWAQGQFTAQQANERQKDAFYSNLFKDLDTRSEMIARIGNNALANWVSLQALRQGSVKYNPETGQYEYNFAKRPEQNTIIEKANAKAKKNIKEKVIDNNSKQQQFSPDVLKYALAPNIYDMLFGNNG